MGVEEKRNERERKWEREKMKGERLPSMRTTNRPWHRQ